MRSTTHSKRKRAGETLRRGMPALAVEGGQSDAAGFGGCLLSRPGGIVDETVVANADVGSKRGEMLLGVLE